MALDELRREMDLAADAERVAWIKVRRRGPGTPDYNEELWRAWNEAVRLLAAAHQKFLDANPL